MTDLMCMLWADSGDEETVSEPFQSKIINKLQAMGIQSFENDGNVHFFLPFSHFTSLISQRLEDYAAAATIQVTPTVLKIYFSFLNPNGKEIRAAFGHQRISLPKFCMKLNESCEDFQLKVSPLTGELKLSCEYCMISNEDVESAIVNLLVSFSNESQILLEVFEFLDVTAKSSNSLTLSLLEQIEPFKDFLKQTKKHEYKESKEEESHKKYYPIPKTEVCINNHQSLMPDFYRQNQRSKCIESVRPYFEKKISCLPKRNNSQSAHRNYIRMEIEDCPATRRIIEKVQKSEKTRRVARFREKLEIKQDGKRFRACFQYEPNSRVISQVNETSLLLNQKGTFLTFIKEYIHDLKQDSKLRNQFIITMQEKESSIPLSEYLRINRMVLSLRTKIKIVYQIFAIACFTDFQIFCPSFTTQNFLINVEGRLIIDSIHTSPRDPLMEIAQTCSTVLFDRPYFNERIIQSDFGLETHSTEYRKVYRSLSETDLQRYGPAVLMKVIYKSLQILEKKNGEDWKEMRKRKQKNSQGTERSFLEDLLLFYITLTKFVTDHQV